MLQQPDQIRQTKTEGGELFRQIDRNMGHQVKKQNKHILTFIKICSLNSCSQRTSSHHHSGQQTIWSSARRQLSWEGPVMAHGDKQADTKLYMQRGMLKPGTSGAMHGMALPHSVQRNYGPFNLLCKQS